MEESTLSNVQKFTRVILLAAAFFISGKLGLLLALPPGYATTIWPPAGIALAAVLLWGDFMLAGIWLGSFLLNISIPNFIPDYLLYLKPVFIAIIIASGSSIAAYTAKTLIKKYVGFPNTLDDAKKIFAFLALGGPLASIVSATIGVSALYFNGVLPVDNLHFSWFTWWIGDSLGVIVFAPVLIVSFQEKGRRLGVILPLSITFAGAIALFLISNKTEQEKLKSDFVRRSQSFLKALQESNDNAFDALSSIESFYASSHEVNRDEFHNFVQHLLRRFPSVRAFSWNIYVKDSERNQFESTQKKLGWKDFTITERDRRGNLIKAQKRPDYAVILYTEPENDKQFIGFDSFSIADRLQTMTEAHASHSPKATGRIYFLKEAAKRNGIIVYQPIYKNYLASQPMPKNSKNILGYVAGVFELQQMFALPLIGMKEQGIGLEIDDETFPGKPDPIYLEKPLDLGRKVDDLNCIFYIDFAGRKLKFTFYQPKDFLLAPRPWTSYLVLLGALLFTGLLGVLLLLSTGRTSRVEALVKIRTKEMEEAREIALKASNMKSDFLANMSHEIRTPMNGVMGMATLLLDTKLNTEQFEYTENIQKSAKSLVTLINDILDFSKIEAGKLEIEEIDFDLNELLSDIHKTFSFVAKSKNVELEFNAPKFEKSFRGDPTRIRQVLLNLINNALKFTEKGKVKIDVIDKYSLIHFEVSDTGLGVPEAAFEKIFESFAQLDSSTTRRFGGTGLGLSISSRLVGLMKGKIGLRSKEDEGSTFWFDLPLIKNSSRLSRKLPGKGQKIERRVLGSVRILVAEDNLVNQKVISKMLEKFGFQATVVNNGKEVMRILRQKAFDLILMDCQMPEMDGYEATAAIRNNAEFFEIKSIPIIALTASAIKGDREKCLAAGMNDYVSKPINFDNLTVAIDKCLHSEKKAA